MKNIIFCLLFVFSTSAFCQDANIKNDELFLQYVTEYVNYSKNRSPSEKLEQALISFNSKLGNNHKTLKSFEKAEDKNLWLKKNYRKTMFKDLNEAQTIYTKYLEIQFQFDNEAKELMRLNNELLKKYDSLVIWQALKEKLNSK
jgi:glucosamine 6-phosphate synthetase-like amidotransferase/phosphosugar isomerase protein